MKKQSVLVLCLTILLAAIFGGASVFAEEGIKTSEEISVEVENVDYNFPRKEGDETAFKAVVENLPPGSSITGYQWFLDDEEILGATKDKLELPVINPFGMLPGSEFKCRVMVKTGEVEKPYESEAAVLRTPSTIGTGVLLGDVQLTPGQKAEIGGGIAALSDNGLTLTLDNVQVQSPAKEDLLLTNNNGSLVSFTEAAELEAKEDGSVILSGTGNTASTKETQIILKGENALSNVIQFEEGNPMGTALNVVTLGQTTITGNTLNLRGGANGLGTVGLIDSPSTLHIKGAKINVESTNDTDNPGKLTAAIATPFGLKFTDGAIVNAASSSIGSTIEAGNDNLRYGSIEITNAKVYAVNHYKYSGKLEQMGGNSISALSVMGEGMSMDNGGVFEASIPNWNLQSSNYHCAVSISSFSVDASKPAMTIKGGSVFNLDIKELGTESKRLMPAFGIAVDSKNNHDLMLDNATLSITADLAKRGSGFTGINTKSMDLQNTSTCSMNIRTNGNKGCVAYGIYANRVNIDDSSTDINIDYGAKEAVEVAAIRNKSEGIDHTAQLSVNLKAPDQTVKASVKNGVAIACQYGLTDQPTPFDPNYKPTQIKLGEKAAIETPEKNQISCASMPKNNQYVNYETIYNLADTTAPASDVVIAGTGAVEPVKITKDPSDITVKLGEQASFSIENTGSLPLIYKWEVSADGGKTWTMIENAAGPGYTTPAATEKMKGYQYRCTVSNATGSAVSRAAVLSLSTTPAPAPTPKPSPNTGLDTKTQNSPLIAAASLMAIALLTLGCYQYSKGNRR